MISSRNPIYRPLHQKEISQIQMATSQIRCIKCGVQLVLPQEAQSIECTICKSVTWVRPNNNMGQTCDPISHSAKKFKGMINSMVSSGNNKYPMQAQSGYGYYSQQIPPSRLVVPTGLGSTNRRRRAVLCGISYYGTSNRLKGSVNDIRCMQYFLVQKLGFSDDSILVLTEEERDPYRIPTKYNIQMALRWLVQGSQSGDSLVFHYSGHGSQQLDVHHDEMDGYDETLLPVDHETAGMIIDDDINTIIVRPLPRGAKLHAIIDACHSGTVLDLPFLCRMNREGFYMWEDHSRISATYKGTSGGLAISLSACDDHQNAVDTTSLSNNTSTGAMTYSFIQATQNEPGITYGRLLNAMRHTIREAPKRSILNGPIGSLVRKVFFPRLSQEPQLSSSVKFDVYTTPFSL